MHKLMGYIFFHIYFFTDCFIYDKMRLCVPPVQQLNVWHLVTSTSKFLHEEYACRNPNLCREWGERMYQLIFYE